MAGVSRVRLEGLGAEQVTELMTATAGHDLDRRGLDLARAIHRQTNGNPLFVGETLRHLAEAGRIYQDESRWRYDVDIKDLGIPEGVKDVIGRRLSRLSEAANDVLSIAAVAGIELE